MSRALLTLANDAVRQQAHNWIAKAPQGTRVEFKAPRRSLDQNALMWSLMGQIADQLLWFGERLTADDFKDIISAHLRKARVVPGIDPGTVVPLGMRTSDMTKEEMTNMIECAFSFGAERGVTFRENS